MKRRPNSRRVSPALRQRGAALLVLFLVLGIAAATLLVTALTRQSARIEHDTQTVDALAQARDALIGYAANYRTINPNVVLGYLPLPDVGTSANEGEAAGSITGSSADWNVIGRLPWKTLGLSPLRDGSGECLWYALSGLFKNNPQNTPLNWDTPGQFDLKAEDGTTTLAPNVVAVVFGPGAVISGQNRTPAGVGTATCGGNYNAAAYLDTPNAANAINGILNYYPGTTNSGVAPNNANKPLVAQANGDYYNDRMLAITTDDIFRAIKQRSDFKSDIDKLLLGLKTCLNALSSAPAASANNKGADTLDTCGAGLTPISLANFYTNWKDNLLYAKLPTPTKITIDGVQTAQTCSAVVIFGGQRVDDAHARWTTAAKNLATNYLEGVNATSFPSGTAYSGWSSFDKNNPSRDLIACITPAASASQKLDFSNISGDFNMVTQSFRQGQMVTNLGNQSLQLGGTLWSSRSAVPTVCPVNSDQCLRNLYGCTWSKQSYDFGSGFRAYFKFYLLGAADEGFTFAIADADQNPAPTGSNSDMCGAAGEDLGYSGNNLVTPTVKPPKLALEIDTAQEGNFKDNNWSVYQDSCNCSVTRTSGNTYRFTSRQRNAVFSPNYDFISTTGGRRRNQGTYYLSNVTVSGNSFNAQLYTDATRQNPFSGNLRSGTYTLSYADPYGVYSNSRNDPNANHAALDYWGYNRTMTNPKVSHPDSEDNVHDFGFASQSTANPDPWNPYRNNPNPGQVPGLATVSTLGTVTTDAKNPYYHYVRIEAKRLNDYDGTKRSYQIKVWVLNNNDTNLNTSGELAAFQNTALDYGNITGTGFTGISNKNNTYTFTDNNANFSHYYTTLTVGGKTYYLDKANFGAMGTSFTADVYTDSTLHTKFTGAIPTGSAYQLQFTPPAPTLSPNGYTPLVVYDLVAGQEALKKIRVGFTVGSSTQQQTGRRRQPGTLPQTIVISNFVLETIP